MKIFKISFFIAIIILTDQKCVFPMKAPCISDSFGYLFEYTPAFRELYSYKNDHPEMIGFPKAAPNAKPDLPVIMGSTFVHITVTSIEDDHIVFYTNQHLVLMNIGWEKLLEFLIVICPFIRSLTWLLRPRRNYFLAFVEHVMLLYLLFLYYAPMIGFTSFFGSFRDSDLKLCTIIDEPRFGLEFSFSGFYDGEHFTLTNDWIKLKCPINLPNFLFSYISSLNSQDLIRVKIENNPDQLGFIHYETEDWIDSMRIDMRHIANKTYDKLETHTKAWIEI
jgi:hypothetical protein